jgi:hypothetical protein
MQYIFSPFDNNFLLYNVLNKNYQTNFTLSIIDTLLSVCYSPNIHGGDKYKRRLASWKNVGSVIRTHVTMISLC